MDMINYGEFVRNHTPANLTGFLESNWFPKVLQGQEICSFKSLTARSSLDIGVWSKPQHGYNSHNQRPTPSFYPLASEGSRSIPIHHKNIHTGGLILSNFSNFQTENHVLSPTSILRGTKADVGRMPHLTNEPRTLERTSVLKHMNNESNLKEEVPSCKIFGFSLTEDPAAINLQGPNKRSCTKVHKQGSLVGRAIELSRLNSYEDLLTELERLFNMEGLLCDPNYGWRILYTDSENDMMVIGDDPWHEFVEVVTKIHIYTQEVVEKLTVGMNSDDTKSCLEEAPPAPDVSKSSSVGSPILPLL